MTRLKAFRKPRETGMNLTKEFLQLALKNKEFTLYFQPKYDIFLNQIIGVEALIRWISPERGMISPVDFIPAAESNGFIHPLGEWILTEAIKQAVVWRAAGHKVTVAINVSPFQIQDIDHVHNFLSSLDKVMKEFTANTSDIQLEVTEGTAVSASGLQWLELIRERGIDTAIDDFGTGYSSLAYLKNLGAHTLKIDKSFVDHAPFNLSDCLLLEAMIEIGHSFGMVVVAEGVEKEEQVDFLKVVNCDVIQGYFFSKPLPAEQVTALLNR